MNAIPNRFLNAMIKVGIFDFDGNDSITWVGTGFLTHHRRWPRHLILVTNKHVILGESAIVLNFQRQHGGWNQLKVQITRENTCLWTGHPDPEIDIAVIPLEKSEIESNGLFCIPIEEDHMIETDELLHNGIGSGAMLYAISFPISIVEPDNPYPFVRHGIVAHIQELYNGDAAHFNADVFTFPGNSGGPVLVSYSKGFETEKIRLMGVLRSYLSYAEQGISVQSKRTMITFEDNSGLSVVETTKSIFETIQNIKL